MYTVYGFMLMLAHFQM